MMSRASSAGGSNDDSSVRSRYSPLISSTSVRRRAKEGRRTGPLVPPLKIDLSNCKYELLRMVAGQLGWQVVEGSSDWDLYWTDTSISQERLINLKPTQRINHFYGMLEICRKHSMAQHLAALAAVLPPGLSYDFFPSTWQLPGQLSSFLAAAKAAGKKQAYIVKPDAGCQGKGIKLVQGGSEATVLKNLAGLATLQAVVQQYITQPYLINGLKFDLRIYVLVTDVKPLRVFVFKEGLVRFCTTPYKKPTSKNIDCAYMHLTNYAVNKSNAEAFVAPASKRVADEAASSCISEGDCCSDESAASKWTFAQLRRHLESQGHSWTKLWSSIGQLVVKSLLSVAPHLTAMYRATVVDTTAPQGTPSAAAAELDNPVSSSKVPVVTAAALAAGSCRCFEILGFDVLLDADVRPWLIEINHSPSFNIDSPLDKEVKEQLIMDALRLVRIDPVSIAAAKKAAKRATQVRLLAPSTSARGSSSSSSTMAAALGFGDSGGAQTIKAAQQDCRDALLAARDRWQMKHLGGFERLYPVLIPAPTLMQQLQPGSDNNNSSSSSSSSSSSKKTSNPNADAASIGTLDIISAAQEQQEVYDKILKVSQQLYNKQHQQQAGIHQKHKSATLCAALRTRSTSGTLLNINSKSSCGGFGPPAAAVSSTVLSDCSSCCTAASVKSGMSRRTNQAISMCKRSSRNTTDDVSSSSSSVGNVLSVGDCGSMTTAAGLCALTDHVSEGVKSELVPATEDLLGPQKAGLMEVARSPFMGPTLGLARGCSNSVITADITGNVSHHKGIVEAPPLANATAALAALSVMLATPDAPFVSKPRIRAFSANACSSSSSNRAGSSSSSSWDGSSSSKVVSRPGTASLVPRSSDGQAAAAHCGNDRLQGGGSSSRRRQEAGRCRKSCDGSSSSTSNERFQLCRSSSAPRCRDSQRQQEHPHLLQQQLQRFCSLRSPSTADRCASRQQKLEGSASSTTGSARDTNTSQTSRDVKVLQQQGIPAVSYTNSAARLRPQSAPGLQGQTIISKSSFPIRTSKAFNNTLSDRSSGLSQRIDRHIGGSVQQQQQCMARLAGDCDCSCTDTAISREHHVHAQVAAVAVVPCKSAGRVATGDTEPGNMCTGTLSAHADQFHHVSVLSVDASNGAMQHKSSCIAAAVAEATAALGAAMAAAAITDNRDAAQLQETAEPAKVVRSGVQHVAAGALGIEAEPNGVMVTGTPIAGSRVRRQQQQQQAGSCRKHSRTASQPVLCNLGQQDRPDSVGSENIFRCSADKRQHPQVVAREVSGQLQNHMSCTGSAYLSRLNHSRTAQHLAVPASSWCATEAGGLITGSKVQLPVQVASGNTRGHGMSPGSFQQCAESSAELLVGGYGAPACLNGCANADDSACLADVNADMPAANKLGQLSSRPTLRCSSFGLLGRLRLHGT